MSTTYTVERLTAESIQSDEVRSFFYEVAPQISEMFENKLNYKNTPMVDLAREYIFLICRRDGEIRGYMLCYIFRSPLDIKVKILYQLSFWVKSHSGRTAYHLFQKFIDIGKAEANHIITMLTSHTNIKPSTLQNMGFKEIETLYRMEIS